MITVCAVELAKISTVEFEKPLAVEFPMKQLVLLMKAFAVLLPIEIPLMLMVVVTRPLPTETTAGVMFAWLVLFATVR